MRRCHANHKRGHLLISRAKCFGDAAAFVAGLWHRELVGTGGRSIRLKQADPRKIGNRPAAIIHIGSCTMMMNPMLQ